MMTGRAQPDRMTCWEVAAAGRYPYTGRLGILGPGDRAAVRAALERVRALELRDAPFDQISDGQRQRVLLARAICQEPEVLVLDEPTSFLDLRGKLELLDILKELVRERRVAVVLSLHELDLAQRISDRILCVRGEGIDRCGTPEEIFSGGYIRRLYGVERGSYCESFGCPELEPIRANPRSLSSEETVAGSRSTAGAFSGRECPLPPGDPPENDVGSSGGLRPGCGGDRPAGLSPHRRIPSSGPCPFWRGAVRCSAVCGSLAPSMRPTAAWPRPAGTGPSIWIDFKPEPKPDFCQ